MEEKPGSWSRTSASFTTPTQWTHSRRDLQLSEIQTKRIPAYYGVFILALLFREPYSFPTSAQWSGCIWFSIRSVFGCRSHHFLQGMGSGWCSSKAQPNSRRCRQRSSKKYEEIDQGLPANLKKGPLPKVIRHWSDWDSLAVRFFLLKDERFTFFFNLRLRSHDLTILIFVFKILWSIFQNSFVSFYAFFLFSVIWLGYVYRLLSMKD